MSENQEQAINAARIERDRLLEENFQLLYKISKKASCIKLLRLARDHLLMLSEYKAGRTRH